MKEKYDYLIVGAGLYGSTFAYEATKRGKKCLVIDRRNHIGGNIYCEEIEGIQVHRYGAHIFHTNNQSIWDYLQQFVSLNRFTNTPLANYKGELYNLPFNMNTFYQLWRVTTPEEAKAIIEKQKIEAGIYEPNNLEEQAISMVGTDIYEKLIKGYTEKQWGRKATELPTFIIKRLPVRYSFNNNYFDDRYQGIPEEGYNHIIEKMLMGCEVRLNTDYFDKKKELDALAGSVLFTGMIDEFYQYRYGRLAYRSLRFEDEIYDTDNYQGNAVINFTETDVPYTRSIEHKHFNYNNQPRTIVTKEYPKEWALGDEPYYPVNDEKNMVLYHKYQSLAIQEDQILFGGRLAEYKYYDMHQVIDAALNMIKRIFNE